MEKKGIDVSYAQSSIDWTKAKADIDFAIVRIGFRGNKDKYFEKNYKEARANGIMLGGYFYSYATSVEEARKEAYDCIEFIQGKKFEYPIWYDLEENKTRKQGKKVVSAIANEFCSILEKNGYYVGIYTNLSWANNYFNKSILDRYDIWIAQWSSKCTYAGKYGMWQYSAKGKIDGIRGNVDLDRAYKDYPAIMAANNLNGYTKAPKPKATSQTTGTKIEQRAKTSKVSTQSPKTANKGNSGAKKGTLLTLKNAKLYKSATAPQESRTISGNYYVYDGEVVNGRIRITNSASRCGRKPMMLYVTGWIKL